MSSPDGNKPTILYDLLLVADFNFLLRPLKMGQRKRVTFNKTVYAKEIISREEIYEDNLKNDMWWCLDDYKKFNDDSNEDILKFMLKFPGIDYVSARKLLYTYDFLQVLETINE